MRPETRARLRALAAKTEAAGREARVSDTPLVVERDPAEGGPRMVEVEWVGEQSFLKSPYVQYRLAMIGQEGGFTPHQAAVIKAASLLRIGRFKGLTRRVGQESGLSRAYTWGHKTGAFVSYMAFADADRLLSGPSGHEFRVVGGEPQQAHSLLLPDHGVRLVTDREYKAVEQYVLDGTGPLAPL